MQLNFGFQNNTEGVIFHTKDAMKSELYEI